MHVKHLIAPSVLSCDFGNLQHDIEMLNSSVSDYIHCDIMDGVFVPNISFGFPILHHIKKYASKPLDVHLMIVEPDHYLKQFAEAGADIITVHYETCHHLHRTIQTIKGLGLKASVCLNPHTPVFMLEDMIAHLDMVLLMSVNPGFGGQSFIPGTYERVRQCKTLIQKKESSALIEVDGGVTTENAGKLVEAGADVLVAGSFIFSSPNPKETIQKLKKLQ